MARRKLVEVVRYLQRLTSPENGSGPTDADLLERYVRHHDEAAFELLLWRHAALVHNVCRRVLHREEDAEDAFQATFLAFVRKAHSITRRASLSSWLYKVAYRVALEAQARMQRTAAHERPGVEALAMPPTSHSVWADVLPILDEELNRLPAWLRRPFVLCYLEGKSNEEAAQELGCRLGTIYSRLSRGRELLRKRLLLRGVSLSTAVLTAALVEHAAAAIPATTLVRSTIQSALSFAGLPTSSGVSPRVSALAEGVLRTMFVTKIKMAALMAFVVGVLAAGGVLTHALMAAPQPEAKAEVPAPKQEAALKPDAKPVSVRVVKPTPGGLARMEFATATVVAAQQQQLVPLISGTIKEVSVDIGDHVQKGQVLIVLDAPLLVKEVEEALAALEIAQTQMEEAKATVSVAEAEVRAGGAERRIKLAKLDHAKAALNTAKANVNARQVAVDKARIQESYTQLKAAFDGVVTRRSADPGNFFQPSDSRLLRPLLTLQRMDQVRVVVQISSKYASLVERGDPVDLEIESLPGGAITGQTIARFSHAINPDNRTMAVEIDVANLKQRLLPGMSGSVAIHFKKRFTDAFVVPSSCLVPYGDAGRLRHWVYIVRDGKAHRLTVEVGAREGERTEIVKGLTASDLIITNNPGELDEGTPVKVEKKP